ncbi:MAG TPA: hypothetical protein VFS43_32980 [Polyangiaceae bacterium]|nr:hypothetical protein [Polyangiaceae bacterium]
MTKARGHAGPPGVRAPFRAAAALAAFGLGLLAGPAGAEVRVRVDADGACPAPADLEREVSAWAAPASDASAPRWRLRARGARGGARVELSDPGGTIVLVRAVASNDCQALARAFSLIAHAHFLELGLVRPLPPDPPAPGARPPTPGTPGRPPAPGSPGASPPGPASSAGVANPTSVPTADSEAPGPPPSASAAALPPPPPPEAKAAQGPAAPPPSPGALSLGLGGGLVLPLPASAPPPFGLVDLTARPPSWGLDVRLGAWLSALAAAGEQVSIRRRFGLASLTAGRTFGGRPWGLRPEVGPGLLWTRVDARATEAPAASRLRPALKAGVSLTYELTRALSVRGDLALHVLPWTDRYVVSPLGEVGQGPRALWLFGLGLEGRTAFW